MSSLVAQLVKNLPAIQETWVHSLGWEDPLEEEMTTTPVFLPGEFHGQRSLAGYGPRGRKELDITEQLTLVSLRGKNVSLKDHRLWNYMDLVSNPDSPT